MAQEKTILVVDDSSTIRRQVRSTLENAGYSVLEAENGRDGVNKMESSIHLSMVIADINMPIMNGIEMLRNVQTQISNGLPIVMLTTEGDPEFIMQAKEVGARGWIVKPFKKNQLIATVNKLAR